MSAIPTEVTTILLTGHDWSDVELASISRAYSTAENLLHLSAVAASEHVPVTGPPEAWDPPRCSSRSTGSPVPSYTSTCTRSTWLALVPPR